MLELFIELSEINSLYAIYAGFIIGLAFKYLWTFNCEHWDSTTFSTYKKNHHIHASHLILRFFRDQTNTMVVWIIQIVRRKNVCSDETDSLSLLSN
jgi:hypothetical protein